MCPIVFNKTTQLPTVVDEKTLADPNLNANYEPIEGKVVKMQAPDGKIYPVEGTQLTKAIGNNWKIPTLQEETHQQELQSKDSAGAAFATSFANEALLGAPKILMDKFAPKDAEQIAYSEKEHPVASTAGAAGGIGTSLLYGGGEVGVAAKTAIEGAGEAATKGFLKKLTATAAEGAVDGALYSAPQAVSHLIVGDPDQAYESMLWGLGTGAIVGGGFGATGELLSKLGTKGAEVVAETGSKLPKLADEILLKQHGISAADANNLGPRKLENILKQLQEEGILTKKTKTADYEALRKDAGSKIGELRKMVDDALSEEAAPVSGVADTIVDGKTTNLQDLAPDMQAAGKRAYQKIIEKTPELETSPFLEKERNHLYDLLQKIDETASSAKVEDSSGHLRHTMEAFTKEKSALGNMTKWNITNSETKNRINQIFYSSIRDEEDIAMRNILSKMPGKEEEMAAYMKQKARYEAARDLIKKGNPTNSTSDYGKVMGGHSPGGLTGLAAMYQLITGHPVVAAGLVAEKMALHWAKDKGLPIAAAKIRQIAKNPETSPFLASILVKSAQDGLKESIAKIPSYLNKATDKSINTVSRVVSSSTFREFLGPKSKAKDEDLYDKTTADILQTARDPQVFSQNLHAIMHTFGDNVDIAHGIASKSANAINYLASTIPKNPNPPQPFSDNSWHPTKEQKQEFAERVSIVNNPMSIFNHVRDGHVSDAMVDTLKNVYPTIYNAFASAITQYSFTKEAEKTPYATKLALSRMLGTPLDKSMNLLPDIQGIYQEQPQAQQATPKRGHKATADKAPSSLTEIQRIQNKQNRGK